MTGQPSCYGVRWLNPFQGILQVVELGEARALSMDGVRWEIQVRCAQPELPWGTLSPGEPVMRYLRFGVWSTAAGLRQMAAIPILDLDLLLEATGALTKLLPECLTALPFVPADRHELWLLDKEAMPFALLASSVGAQRLAQRTCEPWAAGARSDHSFRSPRLLERGIPARRDQDSRHHATLLERLVRDAAGCPVRFGWFERDADGGGLAVESAGAKGEAATRRLSAESFPPLLLREAWPQPADRDLVRDYLDWCAPFLLMLSDIDDRTRDRLERAARTHALEVDALYRLYPKVLDTGLLQSIRVEARLRQSRSPGFAGKIP
jgi:hypothetical protein